MTPLALPVPCRCRSARIRLSSSRLVDRSTSGAAAAEGSRDLMEMKTMTAFRVRTSSVTAFVLVAGTRSSDPTLIRRTTHSSPFVRFNAVYSGLAFHSTASVRGRSTTSSIAHSRSITISTPSSDRQLTFHSATSSHQSSTVASLIVHRLFRRRTAAHLQSSPTHHVLKHVPRPRQGGQSSSASDPTSCAMTR